MFERVVKRIVAFIFISGFIVGCQEFDKTSGVATPTPARGQATSVRSVQGVSATIPHPTETAQPLITSPLPTMTAEASPSPIPSSTPSPLPASDLIDGWFRYENEFYQYQFSYPPEATISTVGVNSFSTGELPEGMTFDEYIAQLRQHYPDDICVGLRYKEGYVTFAASPDNGSQYTGSCGRSGVGAYDILQLSERVTIDRYSYTATGWEVREQDDTATWRSEFFSLRLDDGFSITYGTVPNATHEEYLATKETLLQIVASFHSKATAFRLDDTLILSAVVQDEHWALKAYPYSDAFSGELFDTFYGPEAQMENVRRYTQFNFGPQLSPNGRYLLLPGVGGYGGAEHGGSNTGLWLLNLQTDELRQLLPQAKVATWSPYGDQIAYVDGDALYTLDVAPKAEPIARFTHPDLWGLYARWSPTGNVIATMSTKQGELDETGYPELIDTYWLVDIISGQADELATRPGFAIEHVAAEMSWSPTGRYLLVRNELFDMNGQSLPTEFSGQAHWLPVTGQLQVDEREKLLLNGRSGISIVTIDGEEVAYIADGLVQTWAFSHNGRYLAYLDPLTQTDLIIFDLETYESVRLSSAPVNVQSIHWSGNDDYLLLDNGRRASPIWALSIQPGSQAQAIVARGTLLDALPAPIKDVAPGTAVSIPTITPANFTLPEPPSLTQGAFVFFARDDDLWRVDVNGGQLEQITEEGALDWGMAEPDGDWRIVALSVPPIVSPNGRWLAFFPNGQTITLVDINTRGNLQHIDLGAAIPAWSPDSRYLAFVAGSTLTIYDVEDNVEHHLLDDARQVSNLV